MARKWGTPLAFVVVAVLGLASRESFAQTPSLKGAWQIVETISDQGQHDTAPHPSLYIFTDRYYSIQWVTAPRVVPEPRTRALTEPELLAAWRPFIAHAGTYELKGGALSMSPIVAKNPAVMASAGGRGTAEIRFEGDRTVYITATNPAGATIKLRRVE